ncbi:hypothetical protein B0H15DRAFT_946239 [Mycena belliarum]|uniref:Uncharacterized protein n=1 Tax=Mycena belliarum TaxID=1033014 RepID=A0AAD6XQW4_9AGAR|nr:hypothetical protein B0H15DRAFT_946239 [Mycena belliae]
MVTMASGPTKLNVAISEEANVDISDHLGLGYTIPDAADATSSQHRLRTPTLPSPTLARSNTPTYGRPALELAHGHSPTSPTSPLSTASYDTRTRPLLLPSTPLCPPPYLATSPLCRAAPLHRTPVATACGTHRGPRDCAAAVSVPLAVFRARVFLTPPSPTRAAPSASIPHPKQARCARLSESIAIVAFALRRSNRVGTRGGKRPATPRNAARPGVSSCREARARPPSPPLVRRRSQLDARLPAPLLFLESALAAFRPRPAPLAQTAFAAMRWHRNPTISRRRRDPLRAGRPAAAFPDGRARCAADLTQRRIEPPVLPAAAQPARSANTGVESRAGTVRERRPPRSANGRRAARRCNCG